jgi:tetratricopeptide (TPR) repeat protein
MRLVITILVLIHPVLAQEAWTELIASGYKAIGEGNCAGAERDFQTALKSLADSPESDDRRAWNLHELGSTYLACGRLAEAGLHLTAALRLREKYLGANHPDTALILVSLANLENRLGKNKEAEQHIRRAIEIRAIDRGTQDPALEAILAVSLHRQGKYKETERILHGLLTSKDQPSSTDLTSASLKVLLATVLAGQGRFRESADLLQPAIQVLERLKGRDHLILVEPLTQLTIVLGTVKRYEEAEEAGRRAMMLAVKNFGETLDLAHAALALGVVFVKAGRFSEAETLYLKALPIVERTLGRKSEDYGKGLWELSAIERRMGRKREARKMELEARTVLAAYGRNTVDASELIPKRK